MLDPIFHTHLQAISLAGSSSSSRSASPFHRTKDRKVPVKPTPMRTTTKANQKKPRNNIHSSTVPHPTTTLYSSWKSPFSTKLPTKKLPESSQVALQRQWEQHLHKLLHVLVREQEPPSPMASSAMGLTILLVMTNVLMDQCQHDIPDLVVPVRWAATNAYLIAMVSRFLRIHVVQQDEQH